MKNLLLIMMIYMCIGHAIYGQDNDQKYTINSSILVSFTGNGDMIGNGYYTHIDRKLYKNTGVFIGYEQYAYSGSGLSLNSFSKDELSQYIQFGLDEVGDTNYNITKDYVIGISNIQYFGKHAMLLDFGGGYERTSFTYLGSVGADSDGRVRLENRYANETNWIVLFDINYQYRFTEFASVGVSFGYRSSSVSGGLSFGIHF